MTYLDPCTHQNGVFCLGNFLQTSGISFALFLPEPLLGRPLFRENRGHVRSGWRVDLLRKRVEPPRTVEEELWLEERGRFGVESVDVV
jgi:hypothetical protein